MSKKSIVSEEVRRYMSEIGREGGGAGRGTAKALPSEVARANVNVRWQKARLKKEKP
jgi:hypothetical protein